MWRVEGARRVNLGVWEKRHKKEKKAEAGALSACLEGWR